MVPTGSKLVGAIARTTGAVALVFVMLFAGIPAMMSVAAAETEDLTYHTLTILVGPYDWIGTTSPPPDDYQYVEGTTAIVTAVQTDIWVFLYWSVHNLETGGYDIYKKSTIKIVMDEDHLAYACFGYKGGDGGPTKP